MPYFTRIEENGENAFDLLRRKRSVNHVPMIGESAYRHLLHRPFNDLPGIVQKLGVPMEFDERGLPTAESLYKADNLAMQWYVEGGIPEERIAELLNLIPLDTGGYISYLDGVCALQSFEQCPDPSECTNIYDEEPYPYISCFQGVHVGSDFDTGTESEWELFRPERLIWIYDCVRKAKVSLKTEVAYS